MPDQELQQLKLPVVDGESTLIVKRSRFIATIRRMDLATDAQPLLKKIEQEYPKANHYCWAYRYGLDRIEEHCSDAGEPAGTAGRPILGALKRSGLNNTLVVVVRYFGGIKLGVRGLIDAYGAAAEQVIEEIGFEMVDLTDTLFFRVPYDVYSSLMARMLRLNIKQEYMLAHFEERVWGNALIPRSKRDQLNDFLEEWQQRGDVELEWDEKQ